MVKHYIQTFKTLKLETLEKEINKKLEAIEQKGEKIIDLKYDTTCFEDENKDDCIEYSAIIIIEAKK